MEEWRNEDKAREGKRRSRVEVEEQERSKWSRGGVRGARTEQLGAVECKKQG